MGEPKATAQLAGRPLIAYAIAAARAAGLAPFVVAKEDTSLPELDCPVLREPDEPRHPLTGVVAALEHAGTPIVVLPCDAPLVPPDLIAALAGSPSPLAMPEHPRPQPLIARYSPSLLDRLRAALDEGSSMEELTERIGGLRFGELRLQPLGDAGLIFLNANEPADLDRIEEVLASRREGAPA
jgi:molybdenum cofactor guanylyltransferase